MIVHDILFVLFVIDHSSVLQLESSSPFVISTWPTNFQISSASSWGSSKARKCPPLGRSVYVTMLWNLVANMERGSKKISCLAFATPTGTCLIGILRRTKPCSEARSWEDHRILADVPVDIHGLLREVEIFLVEPHGRGDGVGGPVDHDVGQHVVQAEQSFVEGAVVRISVLIIGPSRELLHDVRRQTQGGGAETNACINKELRSSAFWGHVLRVL